MTAASPGPQPRTAGGGNMLRAAARFFRWVATPESLPAASDPRPEVPRRGPLGLAHWLVLREEVPPPSPGASAGERPEGLLRWLLARETLERGSDGPKP